MLNYITRSLMWFILLSKPCIAMFTMTAVGLHCRTSAIFLQSSAPSNRETGHNAPSQTMLPSPTFLENNPIPAAQYSSTIRPGELSESFVSACYHWTALRPIELSQTWTLLLLAYALRLLRVSPLATRCRQLSIPRLPTHRQLRSSNPQPTSVLSCTP